MFLPRFVMRNEIMTVNVMQHNCEPKGREGGKERSRNVCLARLALKIIGFDEIGRYNLQN